MGGAVVVSICGCKLGGKLEEDLLVVWCSVSLCMRKRVDAA